LVLGLINFVRIVIQYDNFNLGLVVLLGLTTTVVIAKVLGAILPMIAQKCKFDPASMSAPLITTIADIGGLLCFFIFAQIILGI
ncbi:MAG: magnesium transporter, partial [Firmicutes bacterium]|nr:magnesium transporter [Bacillota bacterium]